jgi:thiol-disulfide isomerase/thioredoxin
MVKHDDLQFPLRRRCLIAAACLAAPQPGLAAHAVKPWPAGKKAPRLVLTDLDGKAWDLKALRGKPVLLNFWATWCEPCRAEMPSLQTLATRHAPDGLAVLTVNHQESEPTVRRFVDTLGLALPVLLDHDGKATQAWTSRVFPTTVFIDATGQPRQSVWGEVDWTKEPAHSWMRALIHRR